MLGNVEAFPEEVEREPGITLKRERSRVAIYSNQQAWLEQAPRDLQAQGLVIEDAAKEECEAQPLPARKINRISAQRWVRSKSNADITQAQIAKIDQRSGQALRRVGAVYRFPNTTGPEGLVSLLPHALLIRIKPEVQKDAPSKAALAQRLQQLHLKEDIRLSKYSGEYSYFRVQDTSPLTAYQLRPLLRQQESRAIDDIRFETLPMTNTNLMVPNDPLYPPAGDGQPGQWNLQIIGAEKAWDIANGDPNVVVWLLDNGCNLGYTDGTGYAHPDLDLYDEGIYLEGMLPISTMRPGEKPYSRHGTGCAGVIAARINNNAGIAGLAGGCRIFPLTTNGATPTDAEVQRAFNYAAEQAVALAAKGVTARVLSMSVGVPWIAATQSPAGWDSTLIDPAIKAAYDADVVICVASGNALSGPEDDAIFYPARNPHVIACGASDEKDQRMSRHRGNSWGSCYGTELSVVAPGNGLPTTDVPAGTLGGPEYRTHFAGTSAAAPHVAGLAALILSHRKGRNLSAAQVRNIIESTANKVGVDATGQPLVYKNEPGKLNGPWNKEMGYGRINAKAALDAVNNLP
jgi:subtilisin family serine protease